MDFSFAFLFKTCRLAVLFKRNNFFLQFHYYSLTKTAVVIKSCYWNLSTTAVAVKLCYSYLTTAAVSIKACYQKTNKTSVYTRFWYCNEGKTAAFAATLPSYSTAIFANLTSCFRKVRQIEDWHHIVRYRKFNLEVRIFRKVLSRLFLVIFEKSSNIASAFDEKFHSSVP